MIDIIAQAEHTHELSRDEIINILEMPLDSEFLPINSHPLFEAADRVRRKYIGDEVHLRGLIEFSNYCKQNCLYCGLRRDNKKINRYRLSEEQIIDFAKNASELGY